MTHFFLESIHSIQLIAETVSLATTRSNANTDFGNWNNSYCPEFHWLPNHDIAACYRGQFFTDHINNRL